jgi:hypothetical protein
MLDSAPGFIFTVAGFAEMRNSYPNSITVGKVGNISEFQALNPPSKPLVDLNREDRDRVWVNVVEAITAALNE